MSTLSKWVQIKYCQDFKGQEKGERVGGKKLNDNYIKLIYEKENILMLILT